MSKKLKPCKHDDVYDENCSTCLYRELFESDTKNEDDSLVDLKVLLEIGEDIF